LCDVLTRGCGDIFCFALATVFVFFVTADMVKRVSVCVLVAPQVTVPHREVSQQIGATTIMTCLVLANPIGTFSWLRSGQKLVTDGKYELANWTVGEYHYMLAATIHNLELTDYGTYQCVADNEFGHSVGDMSIFGML